MIGTFFANMHWTLLRCGSPRLATSDHPLVPITAGEMQPVSAIAVGGMSNVAEVRFAASPQRLLLLTWRDEYTEEPSVKRTHDMVRNHNTLVIAQAEEQWFHHPSRPAEYRPHGRNWPSIVATLPGMGGLTPIETSRHRVVKQAALEVLETEGPERDGIRVIDWASVRWEAA
jgi:hypothetical protein